MYCKNCGIEIGDGARFCSNCGNPVAITTQPEIAEPVVESPSISEDHTEETPVRKPLFEEFKWNVSEYPDRNVVEKTEEINFNWNADPASITETPASKIQKDTISGEDLEKEVFKNIVPEKNPQDMSAAERIDKFYTFNKNNEEFQKLINSEFQRIKSGNAIEHEISQAEKAAEERFETRIEDSSMEAISAKGFPV